MNTCEPKNKKNGAYFKIAGLVLMVLGLTVILYCVPRWFWSLLVGAVLAAGGFLIWRFEG